MALPTQPVTLSVEQVDGLSRHFSSFRHDVNGCLSLVVAAAELIRYNPEVVKRMGATLVEQPPKIIGKVREFVLQCERTLGLRDPAEASWYAALWKRSNMVPGSPQIPRELEPDEARTLHGELMLLNKELTQLGFTISGVRTLSVMDPFHAAENLPNIGDQFAKTVLKFDQLATRFEESLKIAESGTRRLASGTPSGPVTLSPEQVAAFHHRLLSFEGDLREQVRPLLELSHLARNRPQELQLRMPEFTPQPPKISAEVTNFSVEFEGTFKISRGT